MKTVLLLTGILFCSLLSAQQARFDWAKQVNNTLNGTASSVAIDAEGNVYTTGTFEGTADFDPGIGTFNLTSVGSGDIFVMKHDAGGNFMWALGIGGSGYDKANGIAVKNNALYVSGFFKNSVDFDPGPGTENLTSKGLDDVFVMKLDTGGNLVWARQIGGTSEDQSNDMALDSSGNIHLAGLFYATADFDPGPGTENLTSNGQRDIFVCKLDTGGNYIWAKQLGGSGNDIGWGVAVDNQGNVLTTGYFQATADFDPGTGSFNLAAVAGSADIFVSKLDSSGDFLWAVSAGDSSVDFGEAVTTDQALNVYVTGHFNGEADFDPGTGVFNLSSLSSDVFILKLDPSGNFTWAKSFGSKGFDYGYAIHVDSIGNVYTAGDFSDDMDFDPGPGVDSIATSGNYDFFVSKLDPAGDYLWAFGVGGGLADHAGAMTVDALGNIYIAGDFQAITDFNPGAGKFEMTSGGQMDAFVAKYNQNNCPDIVIEFDSVMDVQCLPPNGYAAVHAMNGTPPYSYSWNSTPPDNDSILVPVVGGFYEVKVVDAMNCSTTTAALIGQPDVISGFDLDVNMVINRGFRPGFPVTFSLDAFNHGCQNVNAVLYLVLTLEMAYDSASVTPDSIIGDTLVWDLGMMSYDSGHYRVDVHLTTDLQTAIGDTVCPVTYIIPVTGDVDTISNRKKYCRGVVSSFDPNDINVYPAGSCPEGYVLTDQKLAYTIRFQNTGTAEAINIFVLDTLSAELDASSIRVLSQSHPMITELLDTNVVKFRFDNIMLPDSFSDEPGSNGYLIYEIDPKPGLAPGTIVRNEAAIYFDFNAPVVTNSTRNTFVPSIPQCDVSIGEVAGERTGLRIYPNPAGQYVVISQENLNRSAVGQKAAELRVFNLMGQEVYRSEFKSGSCTLDTREWNTGIYLVRAGDQSAKLVIQR